MYWLIVGKSKAKCSTICVDVSPEAISCTKENVDNLNLTDRVAVLKGRFFEPIPPHRIVDLVVSNPPYIPSHDLEECEPEVSIHEPRIALDGGADGYDVYNVLIPLAAERARKAVAVEVGIHQADTVRDIMAQSGLHNIQFMLIWVGLIEWFWDWCDQKNECGIYQNYEFHSHF